MKKILFQILGTTENGVFKGTTTLKGNRKIIKGSLKAVMHKDESVRELIYEAMSEYVDDINRGIKARNNGIDDKGNFPGLNPN